MMEEWDQKQSNYILDSHFPLFISDVIWLFQPSDFCRLQISIILWNRANIVLSNFILKCILFWYLLSSANGFYYWKMMLQGTTQSFF